MDVAPFYYTLANIEGAVFPLLRSRKQGGNMEMEKNMENKATEMNANAETMNEMNTVRFMRRYSKADIISFIITLAGLVTAAYISNPYVKGTCIAVAALSLVAPALIMRIIERNSFSLSYVHRVLSEAGLNPVVVEGELHCTVNGKDTTVRVHGGRMLQLSREYQISTKTNLDMYVRAAAATTREVCSVKVGIRRDGDDMGAMVFMAESFCPSAKVFREVFSGYMQALDIAEQRQGDNLREVLTREDKPQRKIGFVIGQSESAKKEFAA